jgi:signal peptidase I
MSSRRLPSAPGSVPKDGLANTSTEPACELAAEVIRSAGEVRLRTFGSSMAPSILPGDFLLIQRAGFQEISVGEVVLFSREGRLFIHRVVDRRLSSLGENLAEPCLITRGDRLRQNDPQVTPREFLGRVVCIKRGRRKVDVLTPANGLNGWLARLLRASDCAAYLYLRLAACRRAILA